MQTLLRVSLRSASAGHINSRLQPCAHVIGGQRFHQEIIGAKPFGIIKIDGTRFRRQHHKRDVGVNVAKSFQKLQPVHIVHHPIADDEWKKAVGRSLPAPGPGHRR